MRYSRNSARFRRVLQTGNTAVRKPRRRPVRQRCRRVDTRRSRTDRKQPVRRRQRSRRLRSTLLRLGTRLQRRRGMMPFCARRGRPTEQAERPFRAPYGWRARHRGLRWAVVVTGSPGMSWFDGQLSASTRRSDRRYSMQFAGGSRPFPVTDAAARPHRRASGRSQVGDARPRRSRKRPGAAAICDYILEPKGVGAGHVPCYQTSYP